MARKQTVTLSEWEEMGTDAAEENAAKPCGIRADGISGRWIYVPVKFTGAYLKNGEFLSKMGQNHAFLDYVRFKLTRAEKFSEKIKKGVDFVNTNMYNVIKWYSEREVKT